MRFIALNFALIIMLATPGHSFAGDDAFSGLFGRFGASYKIDEKPCKVEMELNQSTFIDKLPDAQKLGLMNSDIDQAKINTQPYSLSLAFIFQLIPAATQNIYDDHKDVDRCQFQQYLIAADEYGNDKRILVATYNFNRALYSKINWDQFQNQNMMKVAPGFKFGPEIMGKVTAERQ